MTLIYLSLESGENKNDAYKNANKVLSDIHNYMLRKIFHINMGKSVHMHFRPNLNADERLTCASVCEYGNGNFMKIVTKNLKRLIKLNF